ncbi:MAG TPA: BA14K family protein [Xanthobacteraceae bacterium]|nr:BA14K family protein [Xanthobacteraceae bacterium]
MGTARFAGNPGWNNPGWRWRGGDWRFRRFGGFGVGVATGALLGSAPYWGAWGPYAYDDYAYYDGGYDGAYVTASGGDVQYCMQRFRSYDPSSGTYLGYDGARHPCP